CQTGVGDRAQARSVDYPSTETFWFIPKLSAAAIVTTLSSVRIGVHPVRIAFRIRLEATALLGACKKIDSIAVQRGASHRARNFAAIVSQRCHKEPVQRGRIAHRIVAKSL